MHNNISKYISEENIQFIIDNLILPKYINSIEFSTNTQQQYFIKIPKLHNSTMLHIKLQYICEHTKESILSSQYSFTTQSKKQHDGSTSYNFICERFDCFQIFINQDVIYSYQDLLNYINHNISKYILNSKTNEVKEIKNILLTNKINLF